MSKFAFIILILVSFAACGGVGTTQYTLDVQGSMTVGDAANLQNGKLGILNGEKQVLVGTALLELNNNFEDGLGLNFLNFDASATFNEIGTIRLSITPQVTDNGGIIFKIDSQGVPFGQSFLMVNTTVTIPDGNPGTVLLGGLNFQADQNDPNRLPILGQIPVLNFLFNNQNKRAQVDELLILLTPQIIQDLD